MALTAPGAWVATRKGLFGLDHSGGQWRVTQTSFLGEPVSMFLPPAGGRMLAALDLGHFGVKVQASDDRGGTWHEVATPAFPPQPEGTDGPGTVPWKLVKIWCMERARVGGRETIWAGTLPGGLFRSDDQGESWSLNRALWDRDERQQWFGGGYDVPGIHSVLPYPGREERLLLGISCGGAWLSPDGGQSWSLRAKGMRAEFMPPEQAGDENTQDPHHIVRCRDHPDVLWCQHHNGIWRSGDDGATWVEVTNAPVSNFGFPVAAHPRDPMTAWFVPAQADQRRVPVDAAMVVTRTRDGGKTWQTLRDGLPQQGCYDLVYRHAFVVDATGERLLMGSTTGNLWASDDAGEHWSLVNGTLPPIFAVRFDDER